MGRSRVVWPAALLALFTLRWASAGSPGAGGSYLGDVNVSAILDSFSVSYDKRVRPNYGGPPVDVGVTMYVLSISSLSEVQMVMAELRTGVKLKKVNFSRAPIEYELTPYEVLMKDIRNYRYSLRKIMVQGEAPSRVSKDAHAIILEFIRSRPPLKKVSDRKLAPQPRTLTPREQLLNSIKNGRKLRPVPLPRSRGKTETPKSTPKASTPPKPAPRKLIKVDFSQFEDDDDDEPDDTPDSSTEPGLWSKEYSQICEGTLEAYDLATQTYSRSNVRRNTLEVVETNVGCYSVPQSRPCSRQSCNSSEAESAHLEPEVARQIQEELTCTESWQDTISLDDRLSLTLAEIVHIRTVLTKAELEALPVEGKDFTLDFYFRQFWTDPRLAFRKRPGVETLSVGSEFIKNIWVPDTFFVNEKQSSFHIATTLNEFIRIHHSGSITRSIRLTITASCPMNLQYFPMDRQLCHIEIESFGYTMRDIRYKWNEGPNSVGVSNEVSLPQFKVLGHRQRAMEISLTTGNYSRLACEIQFVRSMGYYLIQIYIPSGLIVIISWVSFWLNRNATPARVALGVTTVLTMTTLMSSTNAALPKISYVKSIDVYLGTCFVMVFASLLEYATVGYMAKRIQMRKNRFLAIQKIAEQKKLNVDGGPDGDHAPKQTEVRFKVHDPKAHSKGGTLESTVNGGRDRGGGPDEEAAGPTPQHIIHPNKDVNKLYGMTPSDIDKYSRIVFPVCFVCFNLMYWIIYLHISDVVADDLVLLEVDK